MNNAFFVWFLVAATAAAIQSDDTDRGSGARLRLTKKGMQYAVDVGIKILQNDIKKEVINQSGKQGRVTYQMKGLRITKANFGSHVLNPVKKGMNAIVSGVDIDANGNFWYKYKRGWFKVSDDIDVTAKLSNMKFNLIAKIANSKTGHPVINLETCQASVSSIDFKFHGGASWLYNIFRGILEKKIRKSFGELVCNVVRKEIRTKAASELATFPIIQKLDMHARIDYGLAGNPVFTKNFVDLPLRGEIFPIHGGHTKVTPKPFATGQVNNKMLYFWFSEFLFETGTSTFFKTRALDYNLKPWSPKINKTEFAAYLNTKIFSPFSAKIQKDFDNLPMMLGIKCETKPAVQITKDFIKLDTDWHILFQAKKNNTLHPLFNMEFIVTAKVQPSSNGENIAATIKEFDYEAKVLKSYIGEVGVPWNSIFFKGMLKAAIVMKWNPYLERGITIPTIEGVQLKGVEVKLEKNAIRVGADVDYTKFQ